MPAGVEAAIDQALAKAPADRFSSAKEFAKSLTASGAGASSAGPSLAVLPFANLSADPENEYFTDGLTEELIGRVKRVANGHKVGHSELVRWALQTILDEIEDGTRQIPISVEEKRVIEA